MKVGTTAETNERRKKTISGIIIITIICAVIFSNILELFGALIVWLVKLIITHWKKILVGIAVLLVGRRILFRRKKK